MTPARLALLVGSLAVLLVAVWLVFVGAPPNGPPPTTIANVPTPGTSSAATSQPAQGSGRQSVAPVSSAASETSAPGETTAPGDPLAKQAPPHSADPKQ